MRLLTSLTLTLGLLALTGCNSSSWCPDCDKNTPIVSVSYQANANYTAGNPVSLAPPVVTGGAATQYQISSGALPPGLNLDPVTGIVSGTPTAPGVYDITIMASNGTNTASTQVVLTILPSQDLTLAYATPVSMTLSLPMTPQAPVLGNATPGIPTSYSVTSGSLPDGLALDGAGTISGTPTTTGTVAFTIQAVNGTRQAVANLSYLIVPPGTLAVNYTVPAALPALAAASIQVSLLNAVSGLPTTYTLTSGALPDGLSLNADGTITGTPTASGVFTVTVQAANAGRTASAGLTIIITPNNSLTLTYSAPQVLTAGQALTSQAPTLGNATPGLPTTFAITTGSLPHGLVLNADGSISGTPDVPGVYAFTIQATNGTRTASFPVSLTVAPSAALGLAYATPVTFSPGTPITPQDATVSNATPGIPTTFLVTVGALPDGLVLNGDGSISGTPTVANTFVFTVQATNGTRTATAALSYTVQVTAPSALAYATPVTYVEQTLITPNLPNPTGGVPTSYVITLGSLPAGLALDGGTGAITGTPSVPTAGAMTVTIKGANGLGNASQTLSITVGPAQPAALGYAQTTVTYTNGTLITPNVPHPTGGTPSSYRVSSGILPAGLSIDPSTGIISGTPTAGTSGAVTVTVRGTNTIGYGEQQITITVNDVAPTALNYATPTTYTDGTPIQVNNPNPAGGRPNTYTLTIGSLPAGLTLDPVSGVISGTPTAPGGPFNLTIQGTNGIGSGVTQAIVIHVNSAAPTALHYTTPVSYILNAPIAPNLPNPVGGTPTTYSIASGSLPVGLSLDPSSGQITGTPSATTVGPLPVTIKALNAALPLGITQALNINVPLPIVLTFAGNPILLPVGQVAELSAVFDGGTATMSGSDGSGPVPIQSGSNVQTPQGVLGSVTYTVTVTNGSAGSNAQASVTIQWVSAAGTLTVPISLASGGGVDLTDASHSSDPFYGLKIVVPAQDSVCADTALTVMKEGATLPAGASVPAPALAVSSTFNFTTSIGYPFKKPVTITLPYDASSLSAGDVPVPFFWDPTYSKWVANGIKAFDPVAQEVTFTTLLPGRYVVMAIPNLANTLSNAASGFVSNTDGWFQPNQGVFDLPGGSSFGMSSFASWYFADRKVANSNAGLYSLFRQGPIASDDVSAKALVSRLANGTLDSWSQVVDQSAYQLTDQQTGFALITALEVTGQPQIFLMGDARPVQANALATVVYAYDNTSHKFSVMDPNYPGTALSITWSPTASTGGWTAYDRAIGYFPTFTQYAMEGHTSTHRLVDYERAFQGANTYWPDPPFATITPTHVGNLVNPVINGTTLQVADASDVILSGTIQNGDETATHIFWNQNGNARTAVPLSGTNFTLDLGPLEDPYGTRVMLETTPNPCDPTFSHSGFLDITIKDQALNAWFSNSCFEQGLLGDGHTPTGWVTEQGSNSGVQYPYAGPTSSVVTATWNSQGVMNSYNPHFAAPSIGSAQVGVGTDPTLPVLATVLDGTAAFRVNHIGTGSQISRIYQVLTIPTIVAQPQLSFYWSAVLQNGGHQPLDQPYADILIQDITDPNNVSNVYFFHIAAADPTYPGWITSGNWGAIPWQKVSLPNMTAYKGHQLKITVTAADCTQGGHGGYVYLDNISCN